LIRFFNAAVLSKNPSGRNKKLQFVLAHVSLDTRIEVDNWLQHCNYVDTTIPAGNYYRGHFRQMQRAQSKALYYWPLGDAAVRRETQRRANNTALMCILRLYPRVCKNIRKYIIGFVVSTAYI
jgi:hypothetical protein